MGPLPARLVAELAAAGLPGARVDGDLVVVRRWPTPSEAERTSTRVTGVLW
ncbi:hypothetical protein ACL02T_06565 [Pseudonocardia sp. RS010]|uniref:hypothetical protein n=1 Tax=Pseudonocardia sp. RS010 TaxID=3385979 RepID=UPI0039A0B667